MYPTNADLQAIELRARTMRAQAFRSFMARLFSRPERVREVSHGAARTA